MSRPKMLLDDAQLHHRLYPPTLNRLISEYGFTAKQLAMALSSDYSPVVPELIEDWRAGSSATLYHEKYNGLRLQDIVKAVDQLVGRGICGTSEVAPLMDRHGATYAGGPSLIKYIAYGNQDGMKHALKLMLKGKSPAQQPRT